MSGGNQDPDLREAFARLRRDDSATAPAFRTLIDSARDRRGPRARAILAPGLAVAVVVAGVLAIVAHERRSPAPPAPAFASVWVEPTAFLLRTPGSEFLSTVPALPAPSRPQAATHPSNS
jgi:hypothetical protein